MTQEKSAEIIDLSASRAAAAKSGAGAFLESTRLGAGLDIKAVSEATKIRESHLVAIESGDASALPATPYAVGFAKVYARYLGLDADAIAEEFKKELTAARPAMQAMVNDDPAVPAYGASNSVKLASLFGILLIAAFAIWIGIQIAGNSERERAANAGNDEPRITVSERRAEPPRPRVAAPGDYEVVPIPPVGEEPTPAMTSDNMASDELAADGSQTAPVATDDTIARDAETPVAVIEPQLSPETQAAETPVLAPVLMPPDATASTPTPAVSQPASQPDAVPAGDTGPDPVRQPDPVPDIIDARLIRSIGPEYPVRCQGGAAALETVSVIFDVTAAGRPANARVTASSDDCFEDAAVAAVMKWRFDPRTINGSARPQTGVQATLNFRR